MLKRNCINVHSNKQLALQIWRLLKVTTGWPYRSFLNFLKSFAKSPLLQVPCMPFSCLHENIL